MKNLKLAELPATRDAYVDYLKAAAIIGVVWIHASAPGAALFRFCVPVFVGLWAFYFERSISKIEQRGETGLWETVLNRFGVLLVPYMAWTCFYLLQKYPVDKLLGMPLHTILVGQFGGFGFSGQYFFVILFQLTFLFPFLRNFINKNNTLLILPVSLLFNWWVVYGLSGQELVSKAGYRVFIYWMPYVWLGVALARGYLNIKSDMFILVFLVFSLSLMPIELGQLQEFAVYTAPSVSFVSIFLLILVTKPWRVALGAASAARVKWRDWVDRGIRYIGQNTFPVFLSNVFFLNYTKSIGTDPSSRILATLLALGGGLLLGEILRRMGLGILVGRRKT